MYPNLPLPQALPFGYDPNRRPQPPPLRLRPQLDPEVHFAEPPQEPRRQRRHRAAGKQHPMLRRSMVRQAAELGLRVLRGNDDADIDDRVVLVCGSNLAATLRRQALGQLNVVTTRREEQCRALMTDRPATNAPPRPWPRPSPATLRKFEERADIARQDSEGYQMAQARMLFLYDLPVAHRFNRFEEECFIRRLAPTTAETYWTAWCKVAAVLDTPPCIHAKLVLSRLKTRSQTYPVRFPKPMTHAHVCEMWQNFYES